MDAMQLTPYCVKFLFKFLFLCFLKIVLTGYRHQNSMDDKNNSITS